MTRYSVQPRNRIFVKGYWFLSFTKNISKNIGKNIGKNISKKVSCKDSQKLLDHAKTSATDALKTKNKKKLRIRLVVTKLPTKLQKFQKTDKKPHSIRSKITW